jgi:hypothetical protein
MWWIIGGIIIGIALGSARIRHAFKEMIYTFLER